MKHRFKLKIWLLQFIAILLLYSFNQISWAINSEKSYLVNNLEGTLEIRAVLYPQDQAQGKEVAQYLLKIDDGKLYNLHFIDKAPSILATGDRVRITKAKEIIHAQGANDLNLDAKAIIVINHNVTASYGTKGPQKLIVFLLNFQNDPNNKPWTPTQINTDLFTPVSNMLYEMSYNKTNLTGNIIGWYTLPINSSEGCDAIANKIPDLAAAAAKNAGIDISSYPRRVYIFPTVPGCAWAGLGTVGGAPSQAWINGYMQPYITAHELGHNLGVWHSNYLKCDGSSSQGNCTRIEYGDYADTMGNSGPAHYNAYQKDILGWLNYQGKSTLRTVSTSGIFVLDQYETANANIKALKILKRTLADGSKDYYYVEYRQAIGFDARLANCGNCDFIRGVIIHQGNDKNINSSELLDMSPLDNNTLTVALLPGASYVDANAANGGLTITANCVNNTGATVSVKFGSA